MENLTQSDFREFSEALDAAWDAAQDPAGDPAAERELLARVDRARELACGLTTRCAGDKDGCDLEDEVAAALERLEGDAQAFFRDPLTDPARAARTVALLRTRSRLLRRMARAAEGVEELDETPVLILELQELRNGLHLIGRGHAAEASEEQVSLEEQRLGLRNELTRLRSRTLEHQASRLLERAREFVSLDLDNLVGCFGTSRRLDRIRTRFHALQDEGRLPESAAAEQLEKQVTAECRRLEELFFAGSDVTRTTVGLDRLSDAAISLSGELDEARLVGFDSRNEAEVDELRRLHRLGRRMARHLSAALAAFSPGDVETRPEVLSPPRVLRRLKRMSRRVLDLWSDRVLALRLTGVFGSRLVRVWEAIIFWLIMVVLLLIVVDHYSDPPPVGTIGWTTWVDTGICAVLLLDFLTRLLLSPRRLSYLRRHALTELLPSIPFGMVANLEHVAALRSLRALRLVRVFRILRVLRPVLRLLRLMLFVARAADRLVEKNAWLLNQNIVFFTADVKDEEVPTLVKRARDLDAWIRRSARDAVQELQGPARLSAVEWRVRFLDRDLAFAAQVSAASSRTPVVVPTGAVRELDVDDVIRTLRDMNDNRVAELMGVEFARELNASLRFFRLPLVRRLPVVRYVLGPPGQSDPLWTTARLGRVLGDLLAFAQRMITWFGDLYGSITGAQFLDRVGMQLIKATARPARRLLLFGMIVGFVLLLVRASRLDFLDAVADAMLKILSLPVLILGVICIVPLLLGIWFRRIAGQATDFFDRVAEAQFLPLTETLKEQRCDECLSSLAERVILPELRLDQHGEPIDPDQVTERFCELGRLDPMLERNGGEGDERPVDWGHTETILLYYRTFLDGACFHRNDTAVANMLLGNLTLENIRSNRLGYGKRERKRLDRLDIGRGKGGVTGPYVWFNFITHSVAQQTARLIIEYNQHCIPVDEVEAADPIDLQLYQDWLAERRRLSTSRSAGTHERGKDRATASGADGTLVYRTTEFNALHFLTANPRRDLAISRRYGDEILNLMREDRENLIRIIFGTFPMEELPKERRTLNPYEFYRRYLSRGKMFLFPLIALLFLLKGMRLLVARLIDIIKDVIQPGSRPLQVVTGRAGFEVARRKIHRMRRPVVFECVRLRAEFDLEYLGLSALGQVWTFSSGTALSDDLRRLNASEREWEEFRELRSLRKEQLRQLGRILEYGRDAGIDLAAEIVAQNHHIVGRENEARRAVTTAYVCDQEGIRRRVEAWEGLRELLDQEHQEKPGRIGLSALLVRSLRRQARAAWPLLHCDRDGQQSEDAPVDGVDEAAADSLARVVVRAGPEARAWLSRLAEEPERTAHPYRRALDVLLAVGEQPFCWSEQLVAVRSVQTLGMLDLSGYERLIWELGGYREDGEADDAGPGHRSQRGSRL